MVSQTSIISGGDPFAVSALSLLLIQAFVVILTARLLSFVLRYLRQPVVVSEVIGGLILGGSALCRIPAFKNRLFPDTSLPGFSLVANFGLVFYLFLIGLELDPSKLLKSVRSSVPISLAGIALPFGLGVAVARLIYDRYADQKVAFSSFLIFTGVAMSITAFPVLARILTERRLLQTKVGQATISAAAIDDVTAWTLLVLVIAIINNASSANADFHNYLTAVYVFFVVVGYVVFLWFTVRPLYRYLLAKAQKTEGAESSLLFVTFLLVLVSSWFTEVIGVHAIFGGFLVGAVIPHDFGFARKLVAQIEDLIMIVFLPLYFAYSGINTRLDQLNDAQSWGFVVLVIVTACAGKLIGCTSAAKLSGLSWRESTAVGILMNTKGLVELIVLNLGLQAGVITSQIFSIFVVMAVITTLMTIPLLSIVYPPKYYQDELHLLEDRDGSNASIAKPENETAAADEVRLLVLLPSMSAANAMVSLSSRIAAHTPHLSVYGLRLLHLDHRMSTVMQASEYNQTIKSDPILSVFHAFFNLQNVRARPLLTFRDEVVPTLIEATGHVSANVVILPQIAQPEAREIAVGTPFATVVQFIDKGYTASTKHEDVNQLTTSSAAAAALAHAPKSGKPASPLPSDRVLVLVLGGSTSDATDDAAASAFAGLVVGPSAVTGGPNMSLVVVSLSIEAEVPSFATDKPVLVDSSDRAALESTLGLRAASGRDVVVIGASVLNRLSSASGEAGASTAAPGGLRHWLEEEGTSSVAVVTGRRKTEFISV